MAKVAFTLRIEEEERAALASISQIAGRPINQLLNDVIKKFLNQQTPEELKLRETLQQLREYRRRNPGFKGTVERFVEAESGIEDPLEGKPYEQVDLASAASAIEDSVEVAPKGRVQSKVRELLGV